MKVSVDYSYDIKEFGRATLEIPDTAIFPEDEEGLLQEEVEKYVQSIMEEGAEVSNINVESYQEIK